MVISNCAIDGSTDNPAVLSEMIRLLTPGGRVGVSDVVAYYALTVAQRPERGPQVGRIAGALSRSEYLEGLLLPVSSMRRWSSPTKPSPVCTARSCG